MGKILISWHTMDGKVDLTHYVDWCHIDKFWLVQRHDIHVKNNVAHFNSCWDRHMKSQLADVNLAIWGIS